MCLVIHGIPKTFASTFIDFVNELYKNLSCSRGTMQEGTPNANGSWNAVKKIFYALKNLIRFLRTG